MMDYTEYYNHVEVLFELVKQMHGKETAFLGTEFNVRCIKAHSLAYLKSNMMSFNFFKRAYNIYISSANYNNLPCFSYNPEVRKQQQSDFNKNAKDFMTGYDLFIDIDGIPEDHLPAWREAKRIKSVFDRYRIPYSIKFSGKGFHFIVPSLYFSSLPDFTIRNATFKKFMLSMVKILDLRLVDMSIYDVRRVYKAAYSFDIKTGRIALPLSDEQFEHFTFSMVDPDNVLTTGVRDRGLLVRQGSEDNIKMMFEDYQ